MNGKDSNTTHSVEKVVGEVSAEVSADATPDTSNQRPMEPLWGDGRNPDPSRICTARRTNGEACRKVAIKGGTVCATHGGQAPQVKRAARVRLEMAADRMAKQLLGIATDADAPSAVKLAAIKDALDRAGLGAKHAVELEVGPTKEYEALLTDMLEGGSRSESRAARGVPDSGLPDWLADELNVVDVEFADEDEPARPVIPREQPALAPEPEARPSGLMSYEDALEQLQATSPPPAPQARRRNRR